MTVLGDPMLDVYVYGETARVSREAPVLIVRKEREEYRLGGAANVAANLAALGVQTELLGVVGSDAAAGKLRSMLQERGVEIAGLVVGAAATPTKTRVLAGATGTAKQQVLRIDDEPELYSVSSGDELAEALAARAATSDALVISDYGLGSVGARTMALATRLSSEGHTLCVDSRYRLGEFRGVTVITPNAPEAEALTGLSLSRPGAIEQAGRMLLEKTGCRRCLLKLGRRGMTLFSQDGASEHVDIVGEEEVADVTGAGDTVIAAFATGLAARLGAGNAMRIANAAAGVVVTKIGTATASPREVEHAAIAAGVELAPWDA